MFVQNTERKNQPQSLYTSLRSLHCFKNFFFLWHKHSPVTARAIKLALDGSGEDDQKLQMPDFGELNNIFENLKQVRPGTAFTLFGDNRGCMVTNSEIKGVNLIDVKHHFFRDQVTQGRLQIETIGIANQITDTFTKPLEPGRFRELRTLLGLTDSGGVLE